MSINLVGPRSSLPQLNNQRVEESSRRLTKESAVESGPYPGTPMSDPGPDHCANSLMTLKPDATIALSGSLCNALSNTAAPPCESPAKVVS